MAFTLLSSPLQGFTDFRFRNAFHHYFGGIDTFYSPYIRLNGKFKIKTSYQNDLLPENNTTLEVIPQIITNDAEEFLDDWKQEAIDEYQRIEEMSCEDFVNRGIKLYMYSVEPKKEKRFVIMMIISTLLGYAGLVTYYWYPYDDIFSVNMFWTGLILSVVFSSLSFFYISIYRSNKKIME